MNFKRTLALKLGSTILIFVLVYILSELSKVPTQWWTTSIVVLIAIFAVALLVFVLVGEVHEIRDDNDLLDS